MPERDQESALLTPSQRQVLRGEADISDRGERSAQSRIRNRVYHGLLDGTIIWQYIDPADREKIFSKWQEHGSRVEYDVPDAVDQDWLRAWDQDARQERDRFRHALAALLAFIYRGVEEGDVDTFESILTNAIATADTTQNRRVTDVTLDIEYRSEFDTDELLKRFENVDPTLTGHEISHLQESGAIDSDDVLDYYSNHSGMSFKTVRDTEVDDTDDEE